jgi:hypothetical protein
MPYGNGMGPAGLGPVTGRGAGYCAGHGVPGFMNPWGGRGAWGPGAMPGFGRGRGRGHRNMYWATGLQGWQGTAKGAPPYPVQPSEEQELNALQGQLKAMEEGVGQIRERIRELEQEKTEEKK